MQTLIQAGGAMDAVIQVVYWLLAQVGNAWEWVKVGMSLVWATIGYGLDWIWLWVDPSGKGFLATMWGYAKTALIALGVLFGLAVFAVMAVAASKNTKKSKAKPSKKQEPVRDEYKPDAYEPTWRLGNRTYTHNPGRGAREV
ncbi:MAG: hypothetical protein HEQ17_00165 [Limnohabitans sp.]|jgi:hypothetical protein|uniref:hypothetical protein n=1 Tax=Limnohabitans sp. TaxID=1907725 RepID=UPI0025FAD273|nr:hypothetical protein [Limnohabitans sp.]MCO4087425.1 hypothetical protein [Limnohabitans sp.]